MSNKTQLLSLDEMLLNFSNDLGSQDFYEEYYGRLEEMSNSVIRYRKKHNMTQRQLGEKMGVTQAMISKIESGTYNYTAELMLKIARAIDCNLDMGFSVKPTAAPIIDFYPNDSQLQAS